jgi:hypothetical protein
VTPCYIDDCDEARAAEIAAYAHALTASLAEVGVHLSLTAVSLDDGATWFLSKKIRRCHITNAHDLIEALSQAAHLAEPLRPPYVAALARARAEATP